MEASKETAFCFLQTIDLSDAISITCLPPSFPMMPCCLRTKPIPILLCEQSILFTSWSKFESYSLKLKINACLCKRQNRFKNYKIKKKNL